MTKQKLFNAVWAGLQGQNFEQCRSRSGKLSYRADGLKCAVGWLIKDKDYNSIMEAKSALEIMDKLDLSRRKLGRLVCHLQNAHDKSPSPTLMEARLRDVAAVHGLRVSG